MNSLRRIVVCATGVATLCLGACSSPVEVEGRLQRLVARYPDQSSVTIYQLEQPDGTRLDLAFDDEAALGLDTGARLLVAGRFDGRRLRVESVRLLAPPQALQVDPQMPPVPKKLAMVLFNFPDDTSQPVSVDQVREYVFVRPTSSVAFMREQSYGNLVLQGKTRVDGDVFGWYTLADKVTACDPEGWSSGAVAAAKMAGVDLRGYDHLVFMFPRVDVCGWAGLGQSPGAYTWINGASLVVINHEIGHNFRLNHASSYSCRNPTGDRVTLSGDCNTSEYGNQLDVMGNGAWHTNAFNKLSAGWLGESNVKRVSESGMYTILPLERPSSGIQVLAVPKDNRYFYYLEARETFGFDSFPATDPAVNGVAVVLAPSYQERRTSLLLDMTPETPTFDDAPLPVGRSFNDPAGKVRITLVERTDAGAVVKIEIPGIPPDAGPDSAADAGAADARADAAADSSSLDVSPDVAPPDAADATEAAATPPAEGGCGCTVGGGDEGGGARGVFLAGVLLAAIALTRRLRVGCVLCRQRDPQKTPRTKIP